MTTIILDDNEQPVDAGDCADLVIRLRRKVARLEAELEKYRKEERLEIACGFKEAGGGDG